MFDAHVFFEEVATELLVEILYLLPRDVFQMDCRWNKRGLFLELEVELEFELAEGVPGAGRLFLFLSSQIAYASKIRPWTKVLSHPCLRKPM